MKAKEFKLEDSKFLGADEFMKDYQEQHKALFVQEQPKEEPTLPQFTNTNPQAGNQAGGNGFNFNFTGVRPHEEK